MYIYARTLYLSTLVRQREQKTLKAASVKVKQ